jgi:aspartokinase
MLKSKHMITIPEVVEDIVSRSPFVEEGISNGLINLSSLARKIKPEIEEKLYKNVHEGAILMALRRLSTKVKSRTPYKKIFKVVPEMIVRSNLIAYTIQNSEALSRRYEKLFSQTDHHRYFFTITQGVFETEIIVSEQKSEKIEKILNDEKISHVAKNLSSITIRLPDENVITPGVYYFILKALAWENINIIDVVSTYSEFTLILDNKEIDKAFSVLKKYLII